MRIVLGLALLCAVALWRMPGTLLDAGLDRATDGALRLADASGTVWDGQAVLMVRDLASNSWQPWLALEWSAEPASLLQGALSWRISSGGILAARIAFTATQAGIEDAKLQGPARFFLARIPNSLAHTGWSGDMALHSPAFRCTWKRRCAGRAELRWTGAASSLLPGQAFGDYLLTVEGSPNALLLQLRTLRGEVQIRGDGRWPPGAPPTFNGTIQGDPSFLQRLPSVGGSWLRPSGDAGAWTIAIP